jgi:hypothetical protein
MRLENVSKKAYNEFEQLNDTLLIHNCDNNSECLQPFKELEKTGLVTIEIYDSWGKVYKMARIQLTKMGIQAKFFKA